MAESALTSDSLKRGTTFEIKVDLDSITPLGVCENEPPNGRKRLERPDGKQILPAQLRLKSVCHLKENRSIGRGTTLQRVSPLSTCSISESLTHHG
jgi:hypothetical protein